MTAGNDNNELVKFISTVVVLLLTTCIIWIMTLHFAGII